MVCVIILTGYERDRHLFGIKYLSKLGIDHVYILYDNVHPDYQKNAKENAEYIKNSISNLFKTELRECNPQDIKDLIRNFTYIMKSVNSELYIDVTNFTKESYLASSVFSLAFGAKMYYVTPKEHASIDVRVNKIFSKLKKDSELFNKFNSSFLRKQDKDIYDEYSNFLDFLKEKYVEEVKNYYKNRTPLDLQVIPLAGKIIELTDILEKILITIFQIGNIKTISELTQHLGLEGKRNMAKVGYQIRQLEKWGLIEVKRTKKTEIKLREFGKGVVMGLLDFKKGSLNGK
jgi:hypothetical protein